MEFVDSFLPDKQLEAARAYDDAIRKQGGTAVNFPRSGTAETPAKHIPGVTSASQPSAADPPAPAASRATLGGAGAVRRRGCAPTPRPDGAPHFRGVNWHGQNDCWQVRYKHRKKGARQLQFMGNFPPDKQLAAARAYDAAVRKQGGTAVNFPRAGTTETQAYPYIHQFDASASRLAASSQRVQERKRVRGAAAEGA
jgi:plasmid stabilization system protein ParE